MTIEFTKFDPCFNKDPFFPHPQQKTNVLSSCAPWRQFNNLAHHLPVAWPTSASRKASSFDAGLSETCGKFTAEKVSIFRCFCWGVPRIFWSFFRVFKTKTCSEMIDDDYSKQNSVFFLPKPAWFSEGDGTNHVSRNFPIRSQWNHHFLRVAMAFLEQEGYSSRQ